MAQPEGDARITSSISKEVIRKYHRTPLALYRVSDLYEEVVSNPNFFDAVLFIFSLIAFAAAFPFYPFIVIAVLAAALLVFTLRQPFLGLVLLMIMIFPMLMYQTPALAYIFVIVMTVALVFGYRHYRTLSFAAILVPLALSPLGYILSIPAFILGVLVVGYKRAIVLTVIFVLAIVMLSAVTNVQNSAYISYSAITGYMKNSNSPALNYSAVRNPQDSIFTFTQGIGRVASNFANADVVAAMPSEFAAMIGALAIGPVQYLIDIIGLAAIAVAIDFSAVASRSFYKGTNASLIGVGYPALFIGMSYLSNTGFTIVLPLASFLIAPAALLILELYRIDIVKALDVRKEDLRMKFGDAFEDLAASSPTEKFSDIGNYESTKKELKEAIISPIEERAVSRAYNIQPVKGILLFGPPGTGKTMLMRAIANDIRAGFFLVRAPDLISSYPGETEKRLNNIFTIARKNAPCILFFDEIDSIARSRSSSADETHRQVLSELLVQMDGFQKLKRVVVVGATNVPNQIDAAILRPGRFDRAIYMPLPDFNGRKEIFRIYLSKLPISRNVNVSTLAKASERFSGADIKTLCDNVAQEVAQEAAGTHKVLEITEEDLVGAIASIKPSTTLSELKEYDKFRMDFERRMLKQDVVEKKEKQKIEDVVGLDDAKKAFIDAVKTPLEHPELVKRYNVKPIKGILMFGPPGVGKTLFMKAAASELGGVSIIHIDGAEIMQQGPTEVIRILKENFNRAIENAPSILFIDEVDSIAPKRRDATEQVIQVTAEFLQEMDGIIESKGVVLVCATNRPSSLDPAMLRPGRLDKLIFVQPPGEQQRKEMFEKYLTDAPLDDKMDFARLAKDSDGYTGADIANICREAKVAALNRSISSGAESKVSIGDIEEVLKKVKPSAPAKLVQSYQAFLDKYGQR